MPPLPTPFQFTLPNREPKTDDEHRENWVALERWANATNPMGVGLIGKQVLGLAAASVVFDPLPVNYTHLLVVGTGKCDTAAGQQQIHLRVNSIATATYNEQSIYSQGGVYNSVQNIGITYTSVGNFGDTTGNPGLFRLVIPSYSSTATFKQSISEFHCNDGVALFTGQYSGDLATGSTARLTRLVFFPAAGNFAAGTVFTVYGLA